MSTHSDTDPTLAAFLAQHATPYDAATDTYRRPPFAAPVKAGKNTAIYNAHSYHTKVPPQGIVPYIEHYTEPGDLVLDPFCGSGMTGVAALLSGRWRVPTDSEREKMSDRQSLADEAHLRTVRRYLAGQLDRRPNDWELAEWLRFCYRREAYAEAIALFPHIHPDHIEPARYAELKKIVAVCRLRAGS